MPSISPNPGAINCDKEKNTVLCAGQDAVRMEAMHTISKSVGGMVFV